MTRMKAFAYHAVGSALALFFVFALVRWVWFPGPLFTAARGINLLGIIVPVDVILGPLITLIIFKPAKKTLAQLKLDVAAVLAVQIIFMLYGVFMIYSARPVYIALVENQFYLVTANEIETAFQKKAKDPHFLQQPFLGPEFVGITLPEDKNLREDLAFSNAAFGVGAQNMPEYYIAFEKAQKNAQAASRHPDKLPGISAQEKQRLQSYAETAQKHGKPVGFIRLYAKQGNLFVALDSQTGAALDIL